MILMLGQNKSENAVFTPTLPALHIRLIKMLLKILSKTMIFTIFSNAKCNAEQYKAMLTNAEQYEAMLSNAKE